MGLHFGSRPLHHWVIALALATGLSTGTGNAIAQVDAKAHRFYEDALVRYEKKDIAGAIIQLKNAIKIDPNSLPVQLLLGKALMQNSEVAAAEVAYMEALRLGVNRAEVVVPLGQAFLAQGKHNQFLEQQTFNPAGLPSAVQVRVLLQRAVAFVDLGNTARAMQSINEARTLDSRSPDVSLAEIPVRIRAGQFREAQVAVDRALLLDPSSAEGHYQKGSLAHIQGDLKSALASYDKALVSSRQHADARVARIGIYQDLARFDDAEKDVRELLSFAPDDARGIYLKALLAERKGDRAGVVESLRRITDLLDAVPPDFIRFRPQMLMLNGLAHHGLGQREKAKSYMEMFYKVQTNTPVSKLLAQIYLSSGDPPKAVMVLETYLKSQPGDGQALMTLAQANMAMGRNAKASELMEQAIKTQDSPAYRTVLGLSLIGAGQVTPGIRELETAHRKDPTQTQAGVALAEMYIKERTPNKAIPVAEALIKQQPNDASFHNLLGIAQGQSGNIVAARASFERSLKLDPAQTQVKLNLGRLEIAQRNYDAATLRLQDILKSEERNSDAMGELAIIAERKAVLPEAQRWLERARDTSSPRDLRWGLALVDFHLRHGQTRLALDAAKVANGKGPDDFLTLLTYARALLASGDTFGARGLLTTATRIGEYNPSRQLEVAALQLAANNPAGAIYSLEKALSTQPNFLPAQALMTEAEFKNGDVAKAEKRAREIMAQYPKIAVGHTLVGMILVGKNQPALAVDAFRKAHDLEPSTATAMKLIQAMATQQGGRPAQAFAQQWLKTNPRDLQVRKALGDVLARQGNFRAAQTEYEEALKVSPNDVEALNNLANVHLHRQDHLSAIRFAERAVALAPGNALFIDTLGWASFRAGQTDRALQLLRDARLRQPGNPEIRYHLAAVLAKTGRTSEAREELEAALKISTAFEGGADAERLLQTLR